MTPPAGVSGLPPPEIPVVGGAVTIGDGPEGTGELALIDI